MDILQSPNIDKWMADLPPNDDDQEYREISQDAKDNGKAQSNLEAHEILMITDTVHCKSCYSCATPGHTYSKCGLKLTGASDEVKDKFSTTSSFFNKLTTSAFVFFFESPDGHKLLPRGA